MGPVSHVDQPPYHRWGTTWMVLPTQAGPRTRQGYRGRIPASPANQRSRRCPRPATHARAENLDLGDNPVSVVAFAVNMMAVSTMEAVRFRHARRRRLLAVLVWFLAIPLGRLLDRRFPERA